MKFSNILSLALAGVAAAQTSSKSTLAEVLAANNDTLSDLNGLLKQRPALVKSISKLTNITILAPSNDAIQTFLNDSAVVSMVTSDPGAISAVLSYHVLNGTYMADNFTTTPMFIPTMLKNATYSNVTGGQVVEAMMGSNNTVSFYSALKAESNVTTANLTFNGGVIHIVDRVLTIPMDLNETAIDAGLSAVAGAVSTLNLTQSLDNMKDITVFAPNNAAFADIASVLANASTSELDDILKYHVIKGTVGYSSVLKNETLMTVEGANVTITVDNGTVYVNSAKVVTPDVLISNGVVHVIDNVLNPNNTSATPNTSTTAPAFSGASTASGGAVPFTSGVPAATETATGLKTSTSSQAGVPRATAAVAIGALFGGAAIVANGM